MANYIVTGEQLTDIADAIRAKTGDSEQIVFPDGFVSSIDSVQNFEEKTKTWSLPEAVTVEPGSIAYFNCTLGTTNNFKAINRIVLSGMTQPPISQLNKFRVAYFQRVVQGAYSMKYLDVFLINPTENPVTLSAGEITLTISYYA